jgi:hypothetical protein
MNDDEDIQLKSYQDDLADDNTPDPFMEEEGEDPSEELGVPADELKDELDKEDEDEDEELLIEDRDDDPVNDYEDNEDDE